MSATVRALYRAAIMPGVQPPYDRLQLKIYYPAEFRDSAEERNTGLLPAAESSRPFPVLIMMPGINMDPECYAWLAVELAGKGVVTVSYSAISEEMPGYVSLTPGLDLSAIAPDTYGSCTSSLALGPIRALLEDLNTDGVLANTLDLHSIMLGGHSAGGSLALYNADPKWCKGLKACFSYAAHSGAATALGWPERTILPLPSVLPTLLMAGDCDGIIAASAHRYGAEPGDACASVRRTFEEGLSSSRQDSYLAIIQGANHLSIAHPHDGTTGRPFLDWPSKRSEQAIRSSIGQLLLNFIDRHLRGSPVDMQHGVAEQELSGWQCR